jgi:hypothetical protein
MKKSVPRVSDLYFESEFIKDSSLCSEESLFFAQRTEIA